MEDGDVSPQTQTFASPASMQRSYTDDRPPWEWKSRYPPEARRSINCEAFFLVAMLLFFTVFVAVLISLCGIVVSVPLPKFFGEVVSREAFISIEFRTLMTYAVGCLGGITFSVKWLIHSVAHGRWHLDRRYWRFFVPLIGGVYACVVLSLLDGGVIGGQVSTQTRSTGLTAAFGFLIGYFSDGVSGLLSNVANAIFGTLEKK